VNTPAHLVFGAAAFGRAASPRVTWAALGGSAVPDLSLYVMTAVSIWVLGASPSTVFRDYYYSEAWQAVFAVDNSLVLWGAFLTVTLARGWRVATAFSGAACLHLALDLPLHNHDARMHFWPLTEWVFVSPVSYWDTSYHAGIVAPIETGATLVLSCWAAWRFPQIGIRVTILALALAQLATGGVWRYLL
jgi:hypothetical protein